MVIIDLVELLCIFRYASKFWRILHVVLIDEERVNGASVFDLLDHFLNVDPKAGFRTDIIRICISSL